MNRLTKYNYCDDTLYLDTKEQIVEFNHNLYKKLKTYEDIEEELGIDLITLFKALKQQKIWTKYDSEIDCCDECNYMFLEDFIYFYWENGKHLVFLLSEYGKNWALKREELENE